MTPHSLQIDNEIVSIDRFLLFWSQNNQTIVQILIVVTLILIVALVFLTLFGSKDEVLDKSGTVGLSPELEKSLQKMLENQATAKSAVFDFSKTGGGSVAADTSKAVGGDPTLQAEALAQVEKMKSEVSAKERAIQELQAQLEAAQSAAKSSTGSSGSAALDARVKELEARLAEYDIISEDIADLSRYKEENEKLKKQLASASAAPVAPAPPAPVAPAPVAPAQVAPAQVAPVPVAPAPVAAVTPVPAPVEPPPSSGVSPIDDDLMKEFAQAVESQKAQTAQAKVDAAAPAPTQENEDLMGQFENFVQKKEGS